MKFDDLCLWIKDRLIEPLPGRTAHEVFRARPTGTERLRYRLSGPPRPGGVIVLLYEDEGIVKFPLIKRPDYVGPHGGQVSLPGGKAEPGENTVQAALRECEEEIGVPEDDIQVLGKLSDFLITASNYVVTPVIAAISYKPVFIPDPYEVSRILETPLAEMVDNHAIKEKEILVAGSYRMMAPHFELANEVVWGATAMMLNELRVVLTSGNTPFDKPG